ncbi:hypothetical protein [Novipirellula artificiosorum]|uniref:Uncharacterized protein n=1 Tax=Novipirellula artificiosorum TaxID=2528016 RepID=A0A5C6DFW0_9BACT|nr:hypothetical protein [Novipirellula artificiosorum]TWU36163.1 hypothetical protein Poly41_39160 [Novipirellula artificiosorum]
MSTSQFDAFSDPRDQADLSSAKTSYRCRPFLGIQFLCCKTYGRIYRNAELTAYVGNCPKCAKRISVPIGPGGTSSRFFKA